MSFELNDGDGHWRIYSETCPACKKAILALQHGVSQWVKGTLTYTVLSDVFVRPMGSQRPPPPPAVVAPYRQDYIEACAVLPYSAKASAALTRRCLQAVLKDKGGFAEHNLADQIESAISKGHLPTHLSDQLDAVRVIGNFAAHAIKSSASGQIIDVEAGEAEWNLDVVESLFDFYFVQPGVAQAKKAALNVKLAAAGKPLLQ